MTIGDIATAIHVTHSAASQTVSEMVNRELVRLEAGATDARQRLVELTDRSLTLMPRIQAEWTATSKAIDALGEELSVPLEQIAVELAEALRRRSFRDRIADAAAELPRSRYRTALLGRAPRRG